MKKQVLIAFAVGLCITANTFAQVPSYIPTNGLVGWFPFNGNTNDESGSGNNGTIIGTITSSSDRFGNPNSSYNFGGNGYVQLPNINLPSFTINAWVKRSGGSSSVISKHYSSSFNSSYLLYAQENDVCIPKMYYTNTNNVANAVNGAPISLCDGQWHMLTGTLDLTSLKIYIDGVLISSSNGGIAKNTTYNTLVGCAYSSSGAITNSGGLQGEIDDIGFWNTALSDQEIFNLYENCTLQTSITPILNTVSSGATTNFNLTTTDNTASIIWQSNASGLGWVNVADNNYYSGASTPNLTINNTQLWNNNQEFRVISTNSDCSDTSNLATIQIADTCITIVTIYDTLLTTVTDTLIINTTLSLPAPNNENTILIYPNPASDHITIDNGNFAAMAGYSIKIENNAGQQVFQNTINQAQFDVDLSTWTGNGLYFVHLIDPLNNTVTVRKIVLQ